MHQKVRGIWSKSLYSVVKERLRDLVGAAKRADLEHLHPKVSRKFFALNATYEHLRDLFDQ